MAILIAPSILSANFYDLKTDIKMIEKSSADWIHFDVMDGHFVPNITFGPDILKIFKKHSSKFLDVHIMVENPQFFSALFIKAGADQIVFHYESLDNPEQIIELIKSIKESNVKVGMSIKPNTNIKVLDPLLQDLDLILIMSVEPGFGGQSFMQEQLSKVTYLKAKQEKYHYLIQIDGGINDQTAKLAINAGADCLVAGSYLFNSTDFNQSVLKLKDE
jgi:ribulose-phosphate 3-epimerase